MEEGAPRPPSPPLFGGGGKPLRDHEAFVRAPQGGDITLQQQLLPEPKQTHTTGAEPPSSQPPLRPVGGSIQPCSGSSWEASRAEEVRVQLSARLTRAEERAEKEKQEAHKLRVELQRVRGQAGIFTAQSKEKEKQIAALSKFAPQTGVKKSKKKERELMAENANLRSKLKLAVEALDRREPRGNPTPHARVESAKPPSMAATTPKGIPVASKLDEEEECEEEEDSIDVEAVVAMLQDRHKAFESFMEGYERREEVKLDSEAMSHETKVKHTEAKSHGVAVNSARDGIDETKRLIENRRGQLNVQAALGGASEEETDAHEAELLARLSRHKLNYKASYTRLEHAKQALKGIKAMQSPNPNPKFPKFPNPNPNWDQGDAKLSKGPSPTRLWPVVCSNVLHSWGHYECRRQVNARY
jgi:hypothetical protein